MKKIRAAIVGYGNIGHFVLDALQVAPDFEIAGIVRRRVSEVPMELSAYPVVSSLDELKDVDVAILCTPTREVEHFAIKALEKGIRTVDSFDIHTQICDLRKTLECSSEKIQFGRYYIGGLGSRNGFGRASPYGGLCPQRYHVY